MPYLGEIASLGTACCWSVNAVLFTRAGRRVGSATVNISRLTVALLAMVGLHLVLQHTPFPTHAGTARFGWLGVSGLIGFALGDAVLFESFVRLGPRLAMLVMTLWPVLAAIMARVFLHQAMGASKVLAMLVTLAGIALVVADKGASLHHSRHRHLLLGLLLALGGALGQAAGFIFSKFGLAGGFSPVSANLIRVTAGTAALGAWQLARGRLFLNLRQLHDRRAAAFILGGALSGPVVGVVLSLYAIDHARFLGVASTLMSLSPVILLPVSVVLEHERVGRLAVVGTLISIAGAAALFLL